MKQLQVVVKNDRNSIHLAIELCKAKTNSVHESILEQVHTPTTIGMTEIHLTAHLNKLRLPNTDAEESPISWRICAKDDFKLPYTTILFRTSTTTDANAC